MNLRGYSKQGASYRDSVFGSAGCLLPLQDKHKQSEAVQYCTLSFAQYSCHACLVHEHIKCVWIDGNCRTYAIGGRDIQKLVCL